MSGKKAGKRNKDGRLMISVNGKRLYNYRVIWKMMKGEDPVGIDHRDHDPTNDSWGNLRVATQRQNCANQRLQKSSLTGLKGAILCRRTGKYLPKIKVGDRIIRLGRFPTPEEAHAAYCVAAREHFGEFWSDGHPHTPANIK